MKGKWLQWASQLQSIAQAGLTFSSDRYDLDRYEKIRNITIEILHEYTDIDHNKIREKVDGAWSLPGGWADVNTSVGESAVRECLEEAGAHVKPKRIIAIHLANKHNNPLFPYTIYKVFVECELIENKFTENTETLDAGFYSLDSLPSLSTERNTRSQIEMCFEAKKHKVFETIFD
ncbi:MAG: NUDIX hydrolase N-terminal domain-containing protein [Bacteroidales bacterium]|nr:NUDIX hydrolase N-terminal domain-containing protein [Bacteroidales bacterium]